MAAHSIFHDINYVIPYRVDPASAGKQFLLQTVISVTMTMKLTGHHVHCAVGEQSVERTLTLTPVIWMVTRMRWCHRWKRLEARSAELLIGSDTPSRIHWVNRPMIRSCTASCGEAGYYPGMVKFMGRPIRLYLSPMNLRRITSDHLYRDGLVGPPRAGSGTRTTWDKCGIK